MCQLDLRFGGKVGMGRCCFRRGRDGKQVGDERRQGSHRKCCHTLCTTSVDGARNQEDVIDVGTGQLVPSTMLGEVHSEGIRQIIDHNVIPIIVVDLDHGQVAIMLDDLREPDENRVLHREHELEKPLVATQHDDQNGAHQKISTTSQL